MVYWQSNSSELPDLWVGLEKMVGTTMLSIKSIRWVSKLLYVSSQDVTIPKLTGANPKNTSSRGTYHFLQAARIDGMMPSFPENAWKYILGGINNLFGFFRWFNNNNVSSVVVARAFFSSAKYLFFILFLTVSNESNSSPHALTTWMLTGHCNLTSSKSCCSNALLWCLMGQESTCFLF